MVQGTDSEPVWDGKVARRDSVRLNTSQAAIVQCRMCSFRRGREIVNNVGIRVVVKTILSNGVCVQAASQVEDVSKRTVGA